MTRTVFHTVLTAAALASTLGLARTAGAQPPPEVYPGASTTATGASAGGEELPDYDRARPNRKMLLTGAGIFGVTYGTTFFIGATNNNEADRRLMIPVVGPWLDLADRRCDQENCKHEGANKGALITSGILQGVGLITVAASFFAKDSHVVPHYESNQAKVWVLPSSAPGAGMGMSAVGMF